MIGIILFAEDYEILITFIELLRRYAKLKKRKETESWYEFSGEKIELCSVLAGGYRNLIKRLKDFLENKVFERIIFNWIKNKEFEKVFIIILYDKDKEQEISSELSVWKEKFKRAFRDVKEKIEIKHKGVGVNFKNFTSEIESYFLRREYEKKEISEEELENYKKLLPTNKVSLVFYLKQILKFKEKPSMKVYLERVLNDEEFCKYLEEEILISWLTSKTASRL